MSQLDSYRRNVQRKHEEITRLQYDKAREASKVATANQRANMAAQAMSRSKSLSTIQSKQREIGRQQTEAANAEKKIAGIEQRIARKQKELITEQGKIDREEKREAANRARVAQQAAATQERQMTTITNTVSTHEGRLMKLESLPEKITVLFLAASPLDQDQLRLDEEARTITEMIRKSEHRDAVQLVTRWAVRPLDLLQAINEHKPTIIHFSGHGDKNGDLVFQDDSGGTKIVSVEAIAQTIQASSDSIRMVFFNSCYSEDQARRAVESIDAAIGTLDSIGDDAARTFSAQFYSSIGFGLSLDNAFQQAKAALMLEGIPDEDVPELFIKIGLQASEIIIVKPEENSPPAGGTRNVTLNGDNPQYAEGNIVN